MKKTVNSLLNTTPENLAKIMDVKGNNERLWQPDELASILQHQLTVPVHVDLGAFPKKESKGIKTAAEANGLLLKSFGDLLGHPNPPVELLRLTKQFAKRHLICPENSPLPPEIASVLYYASIAAARMRCRRRISKLPDSELRDGLDWCLGQAWLDPATRELLKECRDAFGGKNESDEAGHE